MRERVRAAAMSVPRVREIHNLSVLELDGRTEASLHLKLPGEMPLEEAHEVAEEVEGEIMRAVPEVAAVQTHIEPLAEPSPGQEVARDPHEVERDRARGDRAAAPGDALPRHRRGPDRVPDARSRSRPARSPTPTSWRAASRSESARAARRRRRDRAHRAVVRLRMFHPAGHPMERGWVGRIDGDRVVHLAAQTLQSFFTGGGAAREHAEYPLARGRPARRRCSTRRRCGSSTRRTRFAFANANAIVPPGGRSHPAGAPTGRPPAPAGGRRRRGRRVGGFTLLAETRARLPVPKDRDFALVLGPRCSPPTSGCPTASTGTPRSPTRRPTRRSARATSSRARRRADGSARPEPSELDAGAAGQP